MRRSCRRSIREGLHSLCTPLGMFIFKVSSDGLGSRGAWKSRKRGVVARLFALCLGLFAVVWGWRCRFSGVPGGARAGGRAAMGASGEAERSREGGALPPSRRSGCGARTFDGEGASEALPSPQPTSSRSADARNRRPSRAGWAGVAFSFAPSLLLFTIAVSYKRGPHGDKCRQENLIAARKTGRA